MPWQLLPLLSLLGCPQPYVRVASFRAYNHSGASRAVDYEVCEDFLTNGAKCVRVRVLCACACVYMYACARACVMIQQPLMYATTTRR